VRFVPLPWRVRLPIGCNRFPAFFPFEGEEIKCDLADFPAEQMNRLDNQQSAARKAEQAIERKPWSSQPVSGH
jgi:hypothetical protein